MKQTSAHRKDQITSAVITLLFSLLLLLCIYFYRFTRTTPHPEKVVATMLINFGDNNNGNGIEEPAPEEGSLAPTEPIETNHQSQQNTPQPTETKKIVTGNSKKITAKKSTKSKSKNTKPSKSQKSKSQKKQKNKKTKKQKSGDGKGKAAIGNLLKGRGKKKGSQGKNGKKGNTGDPLGGSGNGNSKIGIDRKLVAFIPGTMGRGGKQPTHQCSASGKIKIAYIVDKTGRVTSAKRISGISDPCAVETTIDWIKEYVRAEKAKYSSKGTYTIKF